jgi:hypothetical protein
VASLRHGRHGYAKGRAGRAARGSDDSGVEKGKPGVTAGRQAETDGQTDRQTGPPECQNYCGTQAGSWEQG